MNLEIALVMKYTFFFLFGLLFFSSCETFQDTFTTIEGHITDEITGTPIEGIKISICSVTKFVPGSPCGNLISTESDSSGYYFLEYDLTDDVESYQLRTGATNQYLPSGKINIQVGEKNIIDIQLKPQ